jgi:hypothetical protein
MNQTRTTFSSAAVMAAVLLGGCGGGESVEVIPPTRLDLLSSSTRGMQNIAFSGGSAYLSLSNSATEGTAVLKTGLPVQAASTWASAALGNCGLGPAGEHMPVRAPTLKLLGDTLWMFQPWFESQEGAQEHALCALNSQGTSFAPRDQGLQACNEYFCSTLWMNDLKLFGTRLYSNAGAGVNLFVSDNQGTDWRVLLGRFDAMTCTHQAFHIVGDRLLAGGECPLDDAFLRAYQLSPDGSRLASANELAISVPELENRNIQFIDSVPGTQRVFVGVEGGLLRSDDGGRSFKFVIQHPIEGGKTYPYVRTILTPAKKPNVIVVGGFDKANGKPYLAWSADGGDKWTDLSAMLPGYSGGPGQGSATVTALAEDPQGRILLTLNEDEDAKGRLMLLALGRP